jgi:hypothetical protein
LFRNTFCSARKKVGNLRFTMPIPKSTIGYDP